MSEPQTPPPAPPPAQPAKKGLSPVAWILIGCLGLLLLMAVAMGACGLFVAKKATEFGQELTENPARTMAEIAVKANPELELVSTDDDEETITVRNKRTGEEMTIDWSDFENEGISFRSNEGEIQINNPASEGGATITMRDESGAETQVFGDSGGDNIPSYIPRPRSASEPIGTFHSTQGDKVSGAFRFTTGDSVADVLDFYEKELEAIGFETSKATYSAGGQEGGSVGGENQGDGRTLNIIVGQDDGQTLVNVTYSSGG